MDRSFSLLLHSLSLSLFVILSRPLFSLLRLSKSKKKYNNEETLQVAVEIAELFLVFVFFLLMYIGRCNLILRFHHSLHVSLSLFISFPLSSFLPITPLS